MLLVTKLRNDNEKDDDDDDDDDGDTGREQYNDDIVHYSNEDEDSDKWDVQKKV